MNWQKNRHSNIILVLEFAIFKGFGKMLNNTFRIVQKGYTMSCPALIYNIAI
jgi:hypothetical protein